jgi:hypothetical protein
MLPSTWRPGGGAGTASSRRRGSAIPPVCSVDALAVSWQQAEAAAVADIDVQAETIVVRWCTTVRCVAVR